jgi:hypothetical protein
MLMYCESMPDASGMDRTAYRTVQGGLILYEALNIIGIMRATNRNKRER